MKTLYKLSPKKRIQKDFFVFDTETKIEKNGKDYWGLRARPDSFVFGVVIGHNYSRVIHSVRDFIEEFQHPRYKGKFVYAHNAEYDLNVLFGNIYSFDPTAIFNGKFITATNGNCIFADSMNIYRFGVAKLGEIIGKKKGTELQDNIQYDKPIEYPITKEMIWYCQRDCEIVYDALIQFFEMAGDIKLTQASLSMTYFRRFHQPYNISFDERLVKYFYNSYYGGRTEAFKVGKTNAVCYDVNSMYPNAMINATFPNPMKLKRTSQVPLKTFMHIMKYNEGCALVEIDHKDTYFGFIPYKHEGKLCFPVGKFKVWVNFSELRFALKHEAIEILEVQEVIYAPAMVTPFKDFINTLYDKRKDCDNDLERTIYKLLMNSLYGKFAQRITTETLYIENLERDYKIIQEAKDKNTYVNISIFNQERLDCFLITKKDKKYEPAYAIPSFASYITSYSRIQLLEFLLKHKDCKPVYCDTDSCFFETDPKLTFTNDLGVWSKEGKLVKYIRGLKSYTYVENGIEYNRMKGVPKNAVQIGKNTYQYSNLVKTKEALRRNIDAGEPTVRTKILSHKYTKREVLAGGETKPIRL